MSFLGMKGTGQFAADERPLNWRQGILREYPNGVAPLTAVLSMMDSEATDDYLFHWWTKAMPREVADITGIYNDAALTSAFTTGTKSVGDFVYIKAAQTDVEKFRPGLAIHLVNKDDTTKEIFGKSTQVVAAGTNSYIAILVLQDVPASGGNGVNYARIIGTINPQGGARPQSQLNIPQKFHNLTQIFRDPLSLTRTALQTKLRTVESRVEARREALEFHALRMERAFIDSVASERIGDNNQPETTTRGLIQTIKAYAPENMLNYSTDSAFAGDSWLVGGEEFLDSACEQVFRYGSTEKLVLCGSGALKGVNALAKAKGTINLTPREVAYGLQVVEWVTPHGIAYFMSSPLFTQDEIRRHSMLFVEPKKLKFRYIQDTIFKSDVEYDNMTSSDTGVDGLDEEFLTEAGLEVHFPNHMMFIENVGKDNTLSP